MASHYYVTAASDMQQDIVDYLNDTIFMGLSDSTHAPDKDDDFLDIVGTTDFTANELSGTGYVAGFGNSGRKVLASKTIIADKVNDRVEYDCADITWTAINAGTAAQATVGKEITNDTLSKTIMNIDGGFPITTNGGDFTFQANAEGIGQLAV